jgi:ubiquinone/menaquinone biosynthesis C-methylase UbiE
VSFDVSADAYGRYMGRYSEPLAPEFARQLELRQGQRAIDVGCGPGALTAQLVAQLGSAAVSAVDPSASFVDAMRTRFADVDVRCAGAEELPYADEQFDVAAAQLVVHFMADPVAGLAEMARVTRRGGVVAACVWDHGDGGSGPLSLFWTAVRQLDPLAQDESDLAGSREGHLAELFEHAGLSDVQSSVLTVRVSHVTFDEWWEPFTLGVGPAGAYVATLDAERRAAVASRCAQLLPAPPFDVTASAWSACARV